MAEKKQKKDEFNEEKIKVNKEDSSLAEFTKRPVPSEDELEAFEEKIDEIKNGGIKETKQEEDDSEFDEEINGVSDEEIEESLEEIYQDDYGKRVDVSHLTKIKKHGIIFGFFSFLFTILAIFLIGYSAYNFLLSSGTDVTQVDFYIKTKSEVVTNEEFFYEIYYKNNSNVTVLLPRIEAIYPKNFVVLETEPASKSDTKGVWDLPSLAPQTEKVIKIKGKMIGKEGETGVMFADMSYTPQNFSSEFKKSNSVTTLIKDIGIDLNIDYIGTVLIQEKNEISIDFNAKDNSFFDSFKIRIEVPKNFKFQDQKASSTEESFYATKGKGEWLIKEIGLKEKILPIFFSFTEKLNPQEKVQIYFEKELENGETKIFYEENLIFDIMKSDLNLALIVNGSRENQGINFGDTLNYSIVYNNKGETVLKDVIIMAVFDSEFLDFTTLSEKNGAIEKGNTLTWTKKEISELEELERHEEGTIDFAVNVIDIGQVKPGAKYEIKSYAQFSLVKVSDDEGENQEAVFNEDNRSNEIVNKINSDLKLVEEVRYFDEDNITVGNGPLPLKVGQKTSFKVYWSLTNNLHELTGVNVEVSLPEYMSWDEKNRTNVGEVIYDSQNHKVIWSVGRLPLTVFRADAEFNIAVVPNGEDLNKIMVLKPGTKVVANDDETGDIIEKITEVKTSKLEDDEIAQRTNDGVVGK